MRVLILGANGFIGGRIVARLRAAGHDTVLAGRDTAALARRHPGSTTVQADLLHDDTTAWAPRLAGVEAVVNAAGVLHGELDAVHHRGPRALFDACAAGGIGHVVQISALGAAPDAPTAFLATKGTADAHLLRLRAEGGREGWCVIRPALVLGRGGQSTGLFLTLAALPLPLRLGRGDWAVQPLHVEDLAGAVVGLIERRGAVPPQLDLVGPAPMGTDALTGVLRAWLGLPPRPALSVPAPLLGLVARVGVVLPGATLTPDTLAMLARGSTGDPRPAADAIGWRARPVAEALSAEPAVTADRWQARLAPLRPLLRGVLAVTWLASGLVPLLATPGEVNAALLAGLGLTGAPATAVLLAGALLDLGIGAALLLVPRRTAVVGALGIAVILVFTLLATVAAPELWAHPFAPLLKNAAVIVATLALMALKD
jgi:uncharacterized protein YbjT (DUF2867 family)